MFIFDLIHPNFIRKYCLVDDRFHPSGRNFPEFQIKNVYFNNRIYDVGDNCYIVCDENRTLWWYIDRNQYHFSGIKFMSGDVFEHGGVLIDRNVSALWYRVAKVGGTALHDTFLKDVCKNDNRGFGWIYNENIWIKKDDITDDILNQFTNKFIVYRDPISRFFSQIHFAFYTAKWVKHKIYQNLRRIVYNKVDVFIEYILTVLEINNYFKLYDELHMSHQTFFIEYTRKDYKIDYMVELKDLKKFICDHLKIDFQYRVIGGKNENDYSSLLKPEQLNRLKIALQPDYELYEKNKDKLWKE